MAGAADVLPHERLVQVWRKLGEHLWVLPHQAEKRRSPRAQRNHVHQRQRTEPKLRGGGRHVSSPHRCSRGRRCQVHLSPNAPGEQPGADLARPATRLRRACRTGRTQSCPTRRPCDRKRGSLQQPARHRRTRECRGRERRVLRFRIDPSGPPNPASRTHCLGPNHSPAPSDPNPPPPETPQPAQDVVPAPIARAQSSFCSAPKASASWLTGTHGRSTSTLGPTISPQLTKRRCFCLRWVKDTTPRRDA